MDICRAIRLANVNKLVSCCYRNHSVAQQPGNVNEALSKIIPWFPSTTKTSKTRGKGLETA
jgi:hypothetical protein